jgi:hypothetical protein
MSRGYVPGSEELCKCGCKGWCTRFAILRAWFHDLSAGANGVYGPTTDKAGQQLPCLVAVTCLKGDWPAVCEMGGFRHWSHNRWPCYKCDISKSQLCGTFGITVRDGPWEPLSRDAYDAERGRCRLVRTPNQMHPVLPHLSDSDMVFDRLFCRTSPVRISRAASDLASWLLA